LFADEIDVAAAVVVGGGGGAADADAVKHSDLL